VTFYIDFVIFLITKSMGFRKIKTKQKIEKLKIFKSTRSSISIGVLFWIGSDIF
jgi:hypothetical protein